MKFRILYHISPKRNLKSILKHGLQIGRESPVPRLVMAGSKDNGEDYLIYFTDKKGIDVIVRGWVHCPAVVFKVKVPVAYLEKVKGVDRDYVTLNPYATEWTSVEDILPEWILGYQILC